MDNANDNPHQAFAPFPEGLIPVRLVKRVNRFVVEAHTDGPSLETLALHLPNSGRMQELLPEGALGLAAPNPTEGRKTAGTLLLVRYEGRWVSVDARIPNRLFARGLAGGHLAPFREYQDWEAEVPWGKGRMDFRLIAPDKPPCLVETKSCNLVVDGTALFPDAPTTRGTRHLMELAEAVQKGYRAAVVWFVQRDDATRLMPHVDADPDFARALRLATSAGVEAYAYRCRVRPEGVAILDAVPVVIDPSCASAKQGSL